MNHICNILTEITVDTQLMLMQVDCSEYYYAFDLKRLTAKVVMVFCAGTKWSWFFWGPKKKSGDFELEGVKNACTVDYSPNFLGNRPVGALVLPVPTVVATVLYGFFHPEATYHRNTWTQ
jgi:hypothetical protein